jgi:tRNA A37 threonylcarbamoyltransferase TsaD
MYIFCQKHSHGGIVPPVACDLHRKHIDAVVEEAIAAAKIDINDVTAIATTNRPGKIDAQF